LVEPLEGLPAQLLKRPLCNSLKDSLRNRVRDSLCNPLKDLCVERLWDPLR